MGVRAKENFLDGDDTKRDGRHALRPGHHVRVRPPAGELGEHIGVNEIAHGARRRIRYGGRGARVEAVCAHP